MSSSVPDSITRKLGRLMAISVLSAMAVVAGLGLWQETARYADGKRDALLASGAAFAAASATAVAAGDEAGVLRAIRGIARIPGFTFVSVRDARGRPIADLGSTVRLEDDLDITDTSQVGPLALLASGTVQVAVEIREAGQRVGELRLVAETSDLRDRLVSVLSMAGLGALLALAIGLAISRALQRSITRPLLALTDAMAGVRATHDYGAAVAIGTDDEIGLLAQSFNGMIADIRERDDRLARHRERLEQDVAERTHDLRLAKDEAVAATAAKSEFLATMSHEIRTPMNGMLVMAELLAAADLPSRQRRYAEVIARSGQSLLAIINDILDVSKIESGKLTLEAIPYGPADVADTVVTLFAERARQKGLDLAAYVDPAIGTTTGDPVRVTQILSNLVNNALKFTETGHVLVRLLVAGPERLRLEVIDTGIGIAADKVATIFEAFSQADATTTRKFGGTGLGLSICRRLVEAMGGEVVVTSREGEGSCFAVEIPAPGFSAAPGRHDGCAPGENQSGSRPRPVVVALAGSASRLAAAALIARSGLQPVEEDVDSSDLVIDATVLVRFGRPVGTERVVAVAPMGDPAGSAVLERRLADTLIRWPMVQSEWRDVVDRLRSGEPFERPDTRASVAETGPRFAGARVLVADDAAVNREVAVEALGRLGIVPDLVEDGREAVAAVAARHYDLVLMDGSMPDVDGYEAARFIRMAEARDGGRRTPIVALTAHVVGAVAAAWQEAGMDGVLHKPFTLVQLSACLAKFLEPDSDRPIEVMPAGIASSEPHALLDEDTLDGLVEMGGPDGTFLRRVLSLFRSGAPEAALAFREACRSGEVAAIASAAHRLKSMSLNIGAAGLAGALGSIETAARDHAEAPGPEAMEAVDHLLACTVEALAARFPDAAEDRDAA